MEDMSEAQEDLDKERIFYFFFKRMQIWVMLRMAQSHSSIHAPFPYCCTDVHKSHSAVPLLCVSLLHNNKMTNLLFSSSIHPISSSSSSCRPLTGRQISGTHSMPGVETFFPIIHLFSVSLCWSRPTPHTVRW